MQFDSIRSSFIYLFVHTIIIYGVLKSSGGCVNVISNQAYLKEKQTRVGPHERSEQKEKRMR
jgi:hypothetical protein